MWPDPDKEPLPPPVINSIIKKVPIRSERAPITSYSIWTPLDEEVNDQDGEAEDLNLADNTNPDEDGEEPKEKLPEMN